MRDEAGHLSLEAAAESFGYSRLLGVDVGYDRRWAVVVVGGAGGMTHLVCERVRDGWEIAGFSGGDAGLDGELLGSWQSTARPTGTSRLGVQVVAGRAPEGAVHAFLEVGGETFVLDVCERCFWLVRWDVGSDDAAELLGFEPT